MKIAVLFFGQPRIRNDFNFNLHSLTRLMLALGPLYTFDMYAHLWRSPSYQSSRWASGFISGSINQVLSQYKFTDHIIEDQREFDHAEYIHPFTSRHSAGGHAWDSYAMSQMISQVYSINQVCNLVPPSYDRYILIRLDCEILKDINISDLDENIVYSVQDYIQIFGNNTLNCYKNLLKILKDEPIKSSYIDAEYLRKHAFLEHGIEERVLEGACTLLRNIKVNGPILNESDLRNGCAYITNYGVSIRKDRETIICKFPPKDKILSFQWVGYNIPNGEHEISFNIQLYMSGGSVSTKTHNPDIVDNVWTCKRKVSSSGNPFIFVIFDELLNKDVIEVRISDVTLS